LTAQAGEMIEQCVAEALALAQRGEWTKALAAVERAALAAPDSLEPFLVKGRILRASGAEHGVVLRAFRKAVECGGPPFRRAEALREYALALEPIGRHREAAAALEEAIGLAAAAAGASADGRGGGRPALADLFDLASRAHEKAGDLERALDRHIRAEPHYREERRDIAAFHARQADLLERLGRFADLVRCYARLVDADPDRVLFAQPDAARSTAQIERLKRLLHGINAYLAEHPDDIVALGFKAGFFYRLGRYRNAEQLLVRAIERAPHHFYAYHMLGKVRLKAGRAAQALEAFEKARPLAPDYFDLARDRALALELLGRDEEALEAYRRIETRWPGAGAAVGLVARRELQLRAARLREKLGLLEEAYESYRQASALVLPADREMLRKLASLAMALGRPRDALRHLEEALAAVPPPSRTGAAEMRLAMAEAKAAAGDVEGALGEIDQVMHDHAGAGDGLHRAALARKGPLLARAGRADEAVACADALLAIDPGDEEAILQKGDALKAARRFRESVEWYSRAADRKLAAALIDEGAKLCEAARFDKALGKYNEAFRRNPSSWEVFYLAAAAYARLSQAAPAAKYLEAAVRANRGALAFVERDRDFDAIRGAKEMQDLLARLGTATVNSDTAPGGKGAPPPDAGGRVESP
jgi:tetratricopeptide (TPR) repeat protein